MVISGMYSIIVGLLFNTETVNIIVLHRATNFGERESRPLHEEPDSDTDLCLTFVSISVLGNYLQYSRHPRLLQKWLK